MKHFPQPPIVAATVSGFVVGVFVALIATGVVNHTTPAAQLTATLPPAKSVVASQLHSRVQSIVDHQLGSAYPLQRGPRLVRLSLVRPGSVLPPPNSPKPSPHYRSVYLTIRLNDHPLGRSWRLRAAQADVFQLLKALYTSRLPIYRVQISGTFPLRRGATTAERQVLVAVMNHPTAERIPWKRWGRDHESQLWAMLDYKIVDPGFS